MMTVSEEDVQRFQQLMASMAPQLQMLQQAWKPLEDFMTEFFGKLGVKVKVNKVIYLRNRGKLAWGIVFEGPTHILDQIVMQFGGTVAHAGESVDVRGEEEEKAG
jgi:hypothetical protein